MSYVDDSLPFDELVDVGNFCIDRADENSDDQDSYQIPEGSLNDAETASSDTRKKRIFKKAPSAPRRFKSAYICFVMERMEEVRQTLPSDAKVTEIMKKLASMWKAASPIEKEKYEKLAELDKTRYLDEMSRYCGPMQVPNKRQRKPPGAPKRAMSAFLSFSQAMRPIMKAQHPNLTNIDISSVLAQQWKSAPDEVKRPYIEREVKERLKYHENMAKWKKSEETAREQRQKEYFLPKFGTDGSIIDGSSSSESSRSGDTRESHNQYDLIIPQAVNISSSSSVVSSLTHGTKTQPKSSSAAPLQVGRKGMESQHSNYSIEPPFMTSNEISNKRIFSNGSSSYQNGNDHAITNGMGQTRKDDLQYQTDNLKNAAQLNYLSFMSSSQLENDSDMMSVRGNGSISPSVNELTHSGNGYDDYVESSPPCKDEFCEDSRPPKSRPSLIYINKTNASRLNSSTFSDAMHDRDISSSSSMKRSPEESTKANYDYFGIKIEPDRKECSTNNYQSYNMNYDKSESDYSRVIRTLNAVAKADMFRDGNGT